MSISKHTMSAGAGLAAAALIAMPAPALAHDSLTGSSPESGAASAEAPEGIDLTFSAAPQDIGLDIRVSGPDGSDVTDGEPEIQGSTVTQPLSEQAEAPGEYSVVWRVVSSDGHPIEGAYDYTVEGGDGSASQEPAGGEPAQEPSSAAASGSAQASSDGDDADGDDTPTERQNDDGQSPADTEDASSSTAMWLLIGGGVVVLGAVAAAVVMMRRMGR